MSQGFGFRIKNVNMEFHAQEDRSGKVCSVLEFGFLERSNVRTFHFYGNETRTQQKAFQVRVINVTNTSPIGKFDKFKRF
jgi:hypothetical protein